MSSILLIKDLTYKIEEKTFFKNFNLEVEEKSFTSIFGLNRSGKTMLTKIICAIYPTFDICVLDGISLNKENVLKYITKIGIVTNDIKNPFIFKKVKDELYYPLSNLGYKDNKIEKRIKELTNYFEIEDLIEKDIIELDETDKAKLLIVISLLHKPKLLVIDDIFTKIDKNNRDIILNKLYDLSKKGLTILNITSQVDTIYLSNKIFILKNFKIEKETNFSELLENNYLNKLGFNTPFIINLSLKLKENNMIDKIYYNIEELEKDLWK